MNIIEDFQVGFGHYKAVYQGLLTPLSRIVFIVRAATQLIQIIVGFTVLALTWSASNLDVILTFWVAIGVVSMFLPLYFAPSQRLSTETSAPIPPIELRKTRITSVLDFLFLLPLVFASVFCFSTLNPSNTNPILYYTAIVYISLGLCYTFSPALLVLIAIMCLPCLFVLVRNSEWRDDARARALGASDLLINSLPIFRFKRRADLEVGTIAEPELPTIQEVPTSRITKVKHKFRLFKSGARKEQIAPVVKLFLELDDENITCAICLGEYAVDDELRQLNCKHHYHRVCLDEWLRLNANCPLCKNRELGNLQPSS